MPSSTILASMAFAGSATGVDDTAQVVGAQVTEGVCRAVRCQAPVRGLVRTLGGNRVHDVLRELDLCGLGHHSEAGHVHEQGGLQPEASARSMQHPW